MSSAGQGADVPRLVVAARTDGGRLGAAGGEHGGDQRVQGAEMVEQVGRGIAQRRGEDRNAHPAGRVDGVGERLDVRGVAGGELGPVEDDADPWAGRGRSLAAVGARSGKLAPGRLLRRRVEALAGQQHGVGQERVQCGEIGAAALGQVQVRLGGGPDRHASTGPSARRRAAAHRRGRPPGDRRPGPPPARSGSRPGSRESASRPDRRPPRSQPARPARPSPDWPSGSPRRSRAPTAGRCRTWTAGRFGATRTPRGVLLGRRTWGV